MSAGLLSFLEVPGKNPFPCIFHLLEFAHIHWLTASSSICKASKGRSTASHIIALWRASILTPLSLILSSSFSICKAPRDYISPFQIIQDNCLIWKSVISNLNSTCNFNSPLLWKVTYCIYRLQGLGHGHLGTINLSTTVLMQVEGERYLCVERCGVFCGMPLLWMLMGDTHE